MAEGIIVHLRHGLVLPAAWSVVRYHGLVHGEEQPERSQLEKLSKFRIKQLEQHGLLDTHDGVSKIGGSKQDIWYDKSTGELYVAKKINSEYFERLWINPRDEGVPGF